LTFRLYPSPWDDLPESVLCDQDIYGRLATYLAKVYKSEVGKNKGKPLGVDSALGYLGCNNSTKLKRNSRLMVLINRSFFLHASKKIPQQTLVFGSGA
jgi:hypothetical protein